MGWRKRGGNRPQQYSRRVRRRLEALELFPELARMALAEFKVHPDDLECEYPKVYDWSMQFQTTSPGLFRHKFEELAPVYREVTDDT